MTRKLCAESLGRILKPLFDEALKQGLSERERELLAKLK